MKANIEKIKKKAVPILKQAGVTRSAIFGSYLRSKAEKDSDIDMLVEVPRGTGLFAFVGLQHNLEDALNKKVDLATCQSMHPLLRGRILKDQVPIL